MTLYYVSNAASNGYVVGNDANAGTSKGAAFLTVCKALVTVAAGDTITLNDGTYLSTDGASGAINFSFTKGVTMVAETRRLAILNATAGAGGGTVAVNDNATDTVTISGIVIDARNTQTYCIKRNSQVNICNVVVTDCLYKDFIGQFYFDGAAGASPLTINDCDVTSANCTGGINIVSATSLSVTVNGLTGTLSNTTNTGFNVVSLATVAGRTSSAATIKRVRVTITNSNVGTTALAGGFSFTSVSNVLVEDNVVYINTGANAVANSYAVKFAAANSLDSNGAIIRYNQFIRTGALADGIFFGADTSGANDNLLLNAKIYNNLVSAPAATGTTTHGVSINWQSSGDIYDNYISGFSDGIQYVNMTGGNAWGNVVVCAGYTSADSYVWVGGCTGVTVANNTFYFTGAAAGRILHVLDWNSVHTTGLIVSNNLFYSDATADPTLVVVDVSNTATFTGNVYYSLKTLPSSCFSYQGVTYNTVAAWAAAQEATALSDDPRLFNPPGNDFRPLRSSPGRRRGVAVSAANRDFYGRPFSALPMVGAVELVTTRSRRAA